MLVELTDVHFESAGRAKSYEEEAVKTEILSQVCNSGVLKPVLCNPYQVEIVKEKEEQDIYCFSSMRMKVYYQGAKRQKVWL